MCCDHLTEVFASHRNSWHRGNGGNWGCLVSSPSLSLRHPASMAPFDISRAYGEDRSGQRAANGTLWYHVSRWRQENAAFRCWVVSNVPTYHVMGNLVGVGAWHGSGHDASQSGAQCISLVDGSPGFSQFLHSSACIELREFWSCRADIGQVCHGHVGCSLRPTADVSHTGQVESSVQQSHILSSDP